VRKLREYLQIPESTEFLGESKSNSSQAIVKHLRIAVPLLTEQSTIADQLRKIAPNTNKKSSQPVQFRTLKTDLMQDLFTGKVRVKVDQEEEATAGD